MLFFSTFTANAIVWLVALLLVTMRAGVAHVVQHLRARNWLIREALIFEPQCCISWCRPRL